MHFRFAVSTFLECLHTMWENVSKTRESFQKNAYRPLRWPPLDVTTGVMYLLGEGVPSRGVVLSRWSVPVIPTYPGCTFWWCTWHTHLQEGTWDPAYPPKETWDQVYPAPSRKDMRPGIPIPLVHRQWKHYLRATTVAGGKGIVR